MVLSLIQPPPVGCIPGTYACMERTCGSAKDSACHDCLLVLIWMKDDACYLYA